MWSEEKLQIRTEHGAITAIKWPSAPSVVMYDCDGNPIKIPTCDVCGIGKQLVFARTSYVWIEQCDCKNPE